MNNEITACFPQWANYSHAFRYLFENGFDVKYMTPPPITKKTLELGSKNSPDYVCTPFKYNLFIIRFIPAALPGIGLDEKTTKSSGSNDICL